MTEGAFECKKYGWRQTQGGIIVSFLVHPNDINAALAIAPLGTIYAIGFREMPEGDQSTGRDTAPTPPITTPEAGPEDRERAGKPKRRFSELPRSAQAAILCENPVFQQWLNTWWLAWRVNSETTAIHVVRDTCGVLSRAEFDTDPQRGATWDALHARYLSETNQMAEAR